MHVSDIDLHFGQGICELRAQVHSRALREPFWLWYRFPEIVSQFIGASFGNLLTVALLLPAMKAGEPLEVPTPVSPRLFQSLKRIQTIHRAWDATLSPVEVYATLRRDAPTPGTEVGLFFSSGVDSFYSLIKNTLDHPLNEDIITHLIVVHGVDIHVGEWKSDVFARMHANTNRIAEQLGKRVISAATNLKDLIGWGGLGHGAALASIGLALEGMCKKVYIAAEDTYTTLAPGPIHPLLDPLWSTEACEFVHDGLEASRLDKIRFIAQSQVAMDHLRVCWASERPEFNCGQCSKCLRTMLGLHIAGALNKCQTLPQRIDLELLRKLPLLHAYEFTIFQEHLDELSCSETDESIRSALSEGLEAQKPYFQRLEQAKKSIARFIPLPDRFILVDQDSIRGQLGAARKAIPFLEREGQYNGLPADDVTAIQELERLKKEGAKFIVFWWADFWWLDHYAGFNQHLRSQYPCILEDESLVVFDLRTEIGQAEMDLSSIYTKERA